MLAVFLKTAVIYFVVIIAIRIMGKRQIGDMQPGELVVTILVSEFAAAPISDENIPLIYGIIPVVTLVALEFVISKIVLKSLFVRRLMNGHSAIIIRDGVVDQTLLKKLRVSADDLMEILRGQNVFDISTVAYAILETNGSLSVLLKASYQTVTNADLDIKPDEATMPIPVITDGRIRKEELGFTHITPKKLDEILKKEGLKIGEIFLLTVDQRGNTEVIKRDINNKKAQ